MRRRINFALAPPARPNRLAQTIAFYAHHSGQRSADRPRIDFGGIITHLLGVRSPQIGARDMR
jgi:hypothetical protein